MKFPIFTVLIIALCLFLEFGFLSERKLDNFKRLVCLDSTVLKDFKNEAYRLFVSSFFHANVQHLAVNMLSLWSIGFFLESIVGSFSMATLFLSFTILCNSLTIAIQSFMLNNPQIEFPAILGNPRSCTIGISGVLFAMDILSFSLRKELSQGFVRVLLEVLIISAFIPNVSTIAHLSGVAVGLIYSFFMHSEDAEDAQPRPFWNTLFWICVVGLSSPVAISQFYSSKQKHLRTLANIIDDSIEYYELYGKSWFQSPKKQLKKLLTRWNIIEDKSTLLEQIQAHFEDTFLQVQNSEVVKSTASFLKDKIQINISREMIVWIMISLLVVMVIALIQASCSSPPRRRRVDEIN